MQLERLRIAGAWVDTDLCLIAREKEWECQILALMRHRFVLVPCLF